MSSCYRQLSPYADASIRVIVPIPLIKPRLRVCRRQLSGDFIPRPTATVHLRLEGKPPMESPNPLRVRKGDVGSK